MLSSGKIFMEPNDILEHPCHMNQAEVPFESDFGNTVLSRSGRLWKLWKLNCEI